MRKALLVAFAVLMAAPVASAEMMAVAHFSSPFITVYDVLSGPTFEKLPDPSVLPTGGAFDVAISPGGRHVVVSHQNSPFITIYRVNGTTLEKLPNPSVLPTGQAICSAFSPDGSWLAVGHDTSPFLTIYGVSGDTFTKIPNPSSLPPARVDCVKFNDASSMLAVATIGSPFVMVYGIAGSTFVKIPNPATLPDGAASDVAWGNSGHVLTVSHAGGERITVYNLTGTTLTQAPDPAVLPPGTTGQGVSTNLESTLLAVGGDADPWFRVYQTSGSTLTALSQPSPGVPGTVLDTAFRSTGTLFAVAHEVSPYISLYSIEDTTLTKISSPSVLPTGNGQGVAFITVGDPELPVVKDFDKGLDDFIEGLGFISPESKMFFVILLTGITLVIMSALAKWLGSGRVKNSVVFVPAAGVVMIGTILDYIDLWMTILVLVLGSFIVKGAGEARNTLREVKQFATEVAADIGQAIQRGPSSVDAGGEVAATTQPIEPQETPEPTTLELDGDERQ